MTNRRQPLPFMHTGQDVRVCVCRSLIQLQCKSQERAYQHPVVVGVWAPVLEMESVPQLSLACALTGSACTV